MYDAAGSLWSGPAAWNLTQLMEKLSFLWKDLQGLPV